MNQAQRQYTKDGKVETQLPRIAQSAAGTGEAVIVADMDFKVIALNEGAHATLKNFNLHHVDSCGVVGLPDEIVRILRAHRRDGIDPIVFSINGNNGEYNCRAFLLKSGGTTNITILTLYIKREDSVAEAVRQVGNQYNLTNREQEALMGISMGLTSKQLAKRMKISPNTVKAFLRLIMIKMGAATRAGVVGKLLEQNGPIEKQIHLDREI